jgi:hypothetical protein
LAAGSGRPKHSIGGSFDADVPSASPDAQHGGRMSHTLAGLLQEFNITVVPNSRSWCRGARQTCAGKTLARIFELRGYEHLRSVIISICETKKNNKRMLVAPVVWAVSDVLKARPAWMGSTWLEVLDGIDLAALFELAGRNRRIAQPRALIATLIFERMRPHFDRARGDLKPGRRQRPVGDQAELRTTA